MFNMNFLEKKSRGLVFASNSFLLLLSLTLSILLGEWIVRKFSPQSLVRPYLMPHEDLGQVNGPNQKYDDVLTKEYYSFQVDTNEYGLRMDQSVNPAAHVKKILALGDSFLFGWGVEINNSFYGILKAQVLKETGDIQLLNGGVSTYSTGHVFKALKRFQKMFHVDAVIYFMNSNDIADNINQNPNYRACSFAVRDGQVILKDEKVFTPFKRYLLTRTPYPWFNQHSHLFVLIKKFCFPNVTAETPGSLYPASTRTPQDAARVSLAHVRRLTLFCRENHIPLLIVWTPNSKAMAKNEKRPGVCEHFKKSLLAETFPQQQGVYFFDPTDKIRSLMEKKGYQIKDIYFPEGHFNEIGNSVYAETIKEPVLAFCRSVLNKVKPFHDETVTATKT